MDGVVERVYHQRGERERNPFMQRTHPQVRFLGKERDPCPVAVMSELSVARTALEGALCAPGDEFTLRALQDDDSAPKTCRWSERNRGRRHPPTACGEDFGPRTEQPLRSRHSSFPVRAHSARNQMRL